MEYLVRLVYEGFYFVCLLVWHVALSGGATLTDVFKISSWHFSLGSAPFTDHDPPDYPFTAF